MALGERGELWALGEGLPWAGALPYWSGSSQASSYQHFHQKPNAPPENTFKCSHQKALWSWQPRRPKMLCTNGYIVGGDGDGCDEAEGSSLCLLWKERAPSQGTPTFVPKTGDYSGSSRVPVSTLRIVHVQETSSGSRPVPRLAWVWRVSTNQCCGISAEGHVTHTGGDEGFLEGQLGQGESGLPGRGDTVSQRPRAHGSSGLTVG